MKNTKHEKIRYGVVGLGYIAQAAVLPAFKNAKENSVLTALISEDSLKLRKLGEKYGVPAANRYSFEELYECLNKNVIDALYIATPNSTHRRITEMAAEAGVHVLCEKPLAITAHDCDEMIRATEVNGVRLMTAYRLHFDPGNLRAAEIAHSGEIGDPRIFNSTFTMQIRDPGNIRLKRKMGGGTLYDIGIYCINAARTLFRDEPVEVFASSINTGDKRFREIDEITSSILIFPEGRVANFTTSFGAYDSSSYELIGTKGRLRLENGYEYAAAMKLSVFKGEDHRSERKFQKHDQFGAELLYFSDCVLRGIRPEPSAIEGGLDIQVIEALYASAQQGHPIDLPTLPQVRHPRMNQAIVRPGVRKPEPMVHAMSPSG